MWSRSRYFFGQNVDDSNWYLWSSKQEPPDILLCQYKPLYGPYKRQHKALEDANKKGIKCKILK